jgi:sensor domain CHASE-containing protein
MVERQRQYSGELTVAYIDETLLNMMVGTSDVDIIFYVGSDTYTFKKCKFDSEKLTGKIPDVIPQKIPFTGKTLTVTP